MLSLLVLVVGYNQVLSFYKFSSESVSKSENSFSIMSYNVRLFNLYNWIDDESIPASRYKSYVQLLDDDTPYRN